jgi:hypothetical protein
MLLLLLLLHVHLYCIVIIVVPGLGEVTDVAWAPLSAVIINMMYSQSSPYAAYIGFAEEVSNSSFLYKPLLCTAYSIGTHTMTVAQSKSLLLSCTAV